MRGSDVWTESVFSDVRCEARGPTGHPLRAIRAIVDQALEVLSPDFERLYSKIACIRRLAAPRYRLRIYRLKNGSGRFCCRPSLRFALNVSSWSNWMIT